MGKENTEHITVKEGGVENYLLALQEVFNTPIVNDRLLFSHGQSKVNVSAFTFSEEFDLIIAEVNYGKDIIVERIPDTRTDFYHFNLINQGQIMQQCNGDTKYTQAGSNNGIFIYNGLFPLVSRFEKYSNTQSMGFKFSRNAIEKLMPEALPLLDNLFPNSEPLAYHTGINTALDTMLDQLFHYENIEYGRKPLTMAKGLEIIPILMKTLQRQLDKDQLHGLHIDDYNRMIDIKKYLMSNLETKVSIEDIAVQFGISVSKLKRDFKTMYDTTIYRFYTHAKMDEAFRRLSSGKFSVTEVGYDLGYQNISKFSSMFKKIIGINPKEVIPLQSGEDI